jgi:predicted nucleic acid-binding protein
VNLILNPPRIIFDTNIFVDAAEGARGSTKQTAISPSDWRKVVSFVNQAYTHAVTPATVGELLMGVRNSQDNYFEQQRVPIRKLRESFASTVFLSYVKYFIRCEVFQLEANYSAGLEQDFELVTDIVLAANSKSDLINRKVWCRGESRGVNLDSLATQRLAHLQDWKSQVVRLQGLAVSPQTSKKVRLDFAGWTETKLSDLCVSSGPPTRTKFQKRLDCLYHIESRVLELAKSVNWNLDKIENFIIDQNQMGYVGAPDVVLVTRDKEIVKAGRKSSQTAQVWSWDDLLNKC